MTNDRPSDEPLIERDHPQTRRGEPDARRSASWNDEVGSPRDDKSREARQSQHARILPRVEELAEQAEAVRKEAVGAVSAKKASDE